MQCSNVVYLFPYLIGNLAGSRILGSYSFPLELRKYALVFSRVWCCWWEVRWQLDARSFAGRSLLLSPSLPARGLQCWLFDSELLFALIHFSSRSKWPYLDPHPHPRRLGNLRLSLESIVKLWPGGHTPALGSLLLGSPALLSCNGSFHSSESAWVHLLSAMSDHPSFLGCEPPLSFFSTITAPSRPESTSSDLSTGPWEERKEDVDFVTIYNEKSLDHC